MLSKYSKDGYDSSDEEFSILDERDPRCKVIYTHPDFHVIFQRDAKNDRDELSENVSKTVEENEKAKEKSAAKLKAFEELTDEETESESDSSDEEFKILDERDPRCKVIYTHPDFQAILQSAAAKNKVVENVCQKGEYKDIEKSPEKLKADKDFNRINISAEKNHKRRYFPKKICEDKKVKSSRFFSAKQFFQRLFKLQAFKKNQRN